MLKSKKQSSFANLIENLNKIAIIDNFLEFLFFVVFIPSWIWAQIRKLNADSDPGGKMIANPDPQP